MQYKILLIEDDELMARMYQRILSYENFLVELAGNGLEGFDKAKSFKPDLILLDIMMPVLNGLQTLEKLKTDPDTSSLSIIMLTNLADKKDAEIALQKGAIKYLIKSDYDTQDVVKIIKEIIASLQKTPTTQ